MQSAAFTHLEQQTPDFFYYIINVYKQFFWNNQTYIILLPNITKMKIFSSS